MSRTTEFSAALITYISTYTRRYSTRVRRFFLSTSSFIPQTVTGTGVASVGRCGGPNCNYCLFLSVAGGLATEVAARSVKSKERYFISVSLPLLPRLARVALEVGISYSL